MHAQQFWSVLMDILETFKRLLGKIIVSGDADKKATGIVTVSDGLILDYCRFKIKTMAIKQADNIKKRLEV